jgi:hypothetical protein
MVAIKHQLRNVTQHFTQYEAVRRTISYFDKSFPVPARQIPCSGSNVRTGNCSQHHENAEKIDARNGEWRPNRRQIHRISLLNSLFSGNLVRCSPFRPAHIGLNARSSSTSISIGTLSLSALPIKSVASCTVLARSAATPSARESPMKSITGSRSSIPT